MEDAIKEKYQGYDPNSERGRYHDRLETLAKFPIELSGQKSCNPDILMKSLEGFYSSLTSEQVHELSRENRPQFVYIACPPVLVLGAAHLLAFETIDNILCLKHDGVYRLKDSYPHSGLAIPEPAGVIGLKNTLSPPWASDLLKDNWTDVFVVREHQTRESTSQGFSYYYAERALSIGGFSRGDIAKQLDYENSRAIFVHQDSLNILAKKREDFQSRALRSKKPQTKQFYGAEADKITREMSEKMKVIARLKHESLGQVPTEPCSGTSTTSKLIAMELAGSRGFKELFPVSI